MALNLNQAKEDSRNTGGSGEKVLVPEGNHFAIISSVVDFGKQYRTDWKTQAIVTDKNNKPVIDNIVFITFEFPTCLHEYDEDEGEVPLILGKQFKVSFHEKSNLLKLIKVTNPNATTMADLVSKLCMAEVGRTRTGNAKIGTITQAPGGVEGQFQLHRAPFSYDIINGKDAVFENLPDWMKENIDNELNNISSGDDSTAY